MEVIDTLRKSAPESRDQERRRACRYPANDHPISLGWWQKGQFQSADGVLIDMSLIGAAVLSPNIPIGPRVLVASKDGRMNQWLEATLIRVDRHHGRPRSQESWRLLRVEFVDPCPYELFKAGTGVGHETEPIRTQQS